ncbi:MAG: BatD family protein [Gammaproteobacteria bacterium]|nr:BatD family protein [Gammaproteobacteria bacterium]
MVKLTSSHWRKACAAILFSVVLVANAFGEVKVRVDRPAVDLNESFMLEIIVDTNIDMEPDLSALDENFYRGQISQLSNTSIINGQIRRSRTWSVALMAKATGTQEIPALKVGNEKSSPLSIVVNEPQAAPPGEADVFVASELDQTEAYVQAQILYSIKVYRAVATRQPALRDPIITGAESLVELVGDERSYEAILNGKAYNVVERIIAIYPQESGEITISPARFEARVLRDGRITGRKVFESEAHSIVVNPIPPPPADFPDADWLPARDVQLSEEWSREPRKLQAGEPITRRVTISALGQIETQLPALEPPDVDGMNVYADKPELSRAIEAEGIRGIRKDQYAMIGVRGGVAEIPELQVPWWDIEAGEWQVATLPARPLEVEALPEVADPALTAAQAAPPAATEEQPQSMFDDGVWKLATQLLGAVWLLTVFAWWWSARERRLEPREPAPQPVYKQQAKFVKTARKAAADGDMAAVRTAVIEWGRLQWPDEPPRSIGELAQRLAEPLAGQLRQLSAASYGNAAAEIDGRELSKALRSIDVLKEDQVDASEELLPPLLPPGA